jgi:hypothetical protein
LRGGSGGRRLVFGVRPIGPEAWASGQDIGLISGVMTGVTAGAIGLAGAAGLAAAGFLAAFFFAGFFAGFFLAFFAGFFAAFFFAAFFFVVFFAAFFFVVFFAAFFFAAGFFATFFLAAGFFTAFFLAAGFFFAVAIVYSFRLLDELPIRGAWRWRRRPAAKRSGISIERKPGGSFLPRRFASCERIRQLGEADHMRGTPIPDDVKGDYLIELAPRWYRVDTIETSSERPFAAGAPQSSVRSSA